MENFFGSITDRSNLLLLLPFIFLVPLGFTFWVVSEITVNRAGMEVDGLYIEDSESKGVRSRVEEVLRRVDIGNLDIVVVLKRIDDQKFIRVLTTNPFVPSTHKYRPRHLDFPESRQSDFVPSFLLCLTVSPNLLSVYLITYLLIKNNVRLILFYR